MKKHIPNILTISRFPITALCIFFATQNNTNATIISLVMFIIASITDFFDGYLARKWKIISNFGKIADPIADKALTLGTMAAFCYIDIFPLWALLIICFRELSITIIRLMLLPKNIVLAAIYSGKLKTVIQISVLILIYVLLIYKGFITDTIFNITTFTAILATVAITVYSGVEFYTKNFNNIKLL